MNKKIAILLIAIIGIGLYALPSTVALFSGQHDFKNIDATGNQIDCVKCHGDVQSELGANTDRGTITSASQKPHSGFKCEYCHRIEAGAASGDNAYAIVTYTVDTDANGKGDSSTMMRTLALTLADFEEENFPGSPKYPTEGIINNDLNIMTAQTGGARNLTPAAISPIKTGTDTDATILRIYNEYVQPTMSVAGVPIDTSANKYDGLKLSTVTPLVDAWKAQSSSQRYWTPLLIGAGSRTMTPGTEYHAASLVSCLECHGGFEPLGHYSRVLDAEDATLLGGTGSDNKCYDCHYGYTNRITELAAGGFGITGGADTGAQEAHMEFQTTDDTLTQYKAVGSASYSNGACISCHTHVDVDITYTKPSTLKFNADFMGAGGVEALDTFDATVPVTSHSSGTPVP